MNQMHEAYGTPDPHGLHEHRMPSDMEKRLSEVVAVLPSMKLLIIISNWEERDIVTDLLRDQGSRFTFGFQGMGTVSSEILDLLGLGGSDKFIALSLWPGPLMKNTMDHVAEVLYLSMPGRGIAFSLPLSGISSTIQKFMAVDYIEKRWEEKMEHQNEVARDEVGYALIMSVVNQGYSDELMAAAREAGATGGTVIHARRLGAEDTVKFFGISVQKEKELVMILSKKDCKRAIMHAISTACGMQTEARGIVFSMPVDSVFGVR